MLRKFIKPVGGLLFGCSLLGGSSAPAQTTGYVNGPAPTLSYAEPSAPVVNCASRNEGCAPGVWFNADYLVWWLSAAPSPGPLLTTGSLLDANPGALGQPGTRVVLGDQSISNNAFSGLRLSAGTWIDEQRSVGFEAGGFVLEHRRNFQGFASDGTGAPFLVRPFLNSQTNQQDSALLSFPNFQSGGLAEISSTRFSGWDFNVAFNGSDSPTFRADGLLGVRCLYLAESLTLQQNITSLANQGPVDSALQQGDRLALQDRFGTSSNFYGGQVGGRMTWISDRFITTAVVKLALGVTDQTADLEGTATTRNAGPNIPAGLLVNNGNTGRNFTNSFAVVPELGLNVGYRVSQNITLRAGYTVLYWSDVVRPGNAVQSTINPSLVPTLQGFGTGNPAAPRPTVDSADFWAQGLNLGVEFRF